MKNETELIKSTANRHLTAKGNKFVWSCIKIVADQHGVHPYSQEIKPLKEKLRKILFHLIIDKRHSVEEIKKMVQNRTQFINQSN